MFIHTDFLRAALCCVADRNETHPCLHGIRITPSYIQASDGKVFVSMEHGAETDLDGVFIIVGDIPNAAEGTLITDIDGLLMAIHVDETNVPIGTNELIPVGSSFPDMKNILTCTTEVLDEIPPFQAKYLALPYLMFGPEFIPQVKIRPTGKERPCQLVFDKATNSLFGNPFMVIMPMRDRDLLMEQQFNENYH